MTRLSCIEHNKFMMKLFNANEMYEDETILYTPINALQFHWSLYEKNMPETAKTVRDDYEKHRCNFMGLVVYKKDGGWCWLE